MTRAILLALAIAALAGCDEMARQPRYGAYDRAEPFRDGAAMQPPPEGSLAREDAALMDTLARRPPMTAGLLARGRERYGIYCAPCHDLAGYGDGVVPARGFPRPPSFHEPRLRQAPPARFVQVITEGYGVMYPYADRVAPRDRWAIAAYVKALQLSQAPRTSPEAPDAK